jgi:hypothetical protein
VGLGQHDGRRFAAVGPGHRPAAWHPPWASGSRGVDVFEQIFQLPGWKFGARPGSGVGHDSRVAPGQATFPGAQRGVLARGGSASISQCVLTGEFALAGAQ